MTVLLALLLALGLPRAETNATGTGRQARLQCHSCEEFYTMSCAKATECKAGNQYCVTVVVRMLVRFFYVSRQCTQYCPAVRPSDMLPYKSYVLLKPMPFLYASCCRTPLCNTDSPTINDTEWLYYREAGGRRRPAQRRGRAGAAGGPRCRVPGPRDCPERGASSQEAPPRAGAVALNLFP
ncbi:lymphocyte antigen 6K [Myotis yumanensis]|uniref:lymphocyte antigen 6K n=1 Tax=Myotis yumanensis TaxID=159337 RepID=UPI0038D37AEA